MMIKSGRMLPKYTHTSPPLPTVTTNSTNNWQWFTLINVQDRIGNIISVYGSYDFMQDKQFY